MSFYHYYQEELDFSIYLINLHQICIQFGGIITNKDSVSFVVRPLSVLPIWVQWLYYYWMFGGFAAPTVGELEAPFLPITRLMFTFVSLHDISICKYVVQDRFKLKWKNQRLNFSCFCGELKVKENSLLGGSWILTNTVYSSGNTEAWRCSAHLVATLWRKQPSSAVSVATSFMSNRQTAQRVRSLILKKHTKSVEYVVMFSVQSGCD